LLPLGVAAVQCLALVLVVFVAALEQLAVVDHLNLLSGLQKAQITRSQ
jgi:hypothetical protein